MGGKAQPLCHAQEVSLRPRPSPKRSALLHSRAAEMKAGASTPESVLWRALVNNKLGVSFRRQVPLGSRFVADFVCASRRLVVEVDGPHHALRARADARRDAVLARLGYRVLRLEAAPVMRELPVALARIRNALRGP